ncbi:F0F1 ATP synthase subunit epsilon [Allorhizobium borbori]|uniref:ATP synthase epsilon chain n=1 Tax=Allorhizobium borbori TaxID=485907 RepID=A0A7W6P128_9HYPH|nr:F0F1 ATP synthase subunit epsilon [Allorhizobium borbori]MBB4103894.1 F-type H+-transporting ATPase subunit epsilon [Allorhizobium borbori]
MADNFNFELVSPERLLVSEQASEVVIPATEGEMTVMARHAPTMTTLKPGVVTVKSAAGKTAKYVVFGGFADISATGLTVLAESAVPATEFSTDALQARIDTARKELAAAQDHEKRNGIEEFLSELTQLHGAVIAG